MPDELLVPPGVGGPTPRNGAPPDPNRSLRRSVRRWWRHHSSGAIVAIVVVVLAAGTLTAILATRNLGDVAVPQLPAASSAAPVVTPPTTAAPVPVSTAKGAVVAVIAPGRWTFAVEQGLQVTVVAPPDTVFSSGHKATDVRKGSLLTITGTFVGGVITAKSVTFTKKKKKSSA